MESKIKIDFLKPQDNLPQRPARGLFFLSLSIIIMLGLFFYLDILPYHLTKAQGNAAQNDGSNFFSQLKWLISSPERQVTGEETDRINILLLGLGGKDHAGANLTDTIMLLSFKPSTNQVSLISIPRDLAVNYNNAGWRKINGVNSLAEEKLTGSGPIAISQELETILDQKINYYIKVDFDGFAKLIDEFGGVDVYVDNTFDDYEYPILGQEDAYPISSRFEHLHFNQGLQHLTGTMALKFARSRHALGAEGSDFARAKRQQKILSAFKEKALSLGTIINPYRIEALINAYSENVQTNLKPWEILHLASLAKNIDTKKIINEVLDNSTTGPLYSEIYNGSYLLFPKLGQGNFQELQAIAKNIFELADTRLIEQENAKLIIQNGTKISGLANSASQLMRRQKITVLKTGNALQQDYEHSVIYDFSNGQKPNTAAYLEQKFGVKVNTEKPGWFEALEGTSSAKFYPDFLIILGSDYQISS